MGVWTQHTRLVELYQGRLLSIELSSASLVEPIMQQIIEPKHKLQVSSCYTRHAVCSSSDLQTQKSASSRKTCCECHLASIDTRRTRTACFSSEKNRGHAVVQVSVYAQLQTTVLLLLYEMYENMKTHAEEKCGAIIVLNRQFHYRRRVTHARPPCKHLFQYTRTRLARQTSRTKVHGLRQALCASC